MALVGAMTTVFIFLRSIRLVFAAVCTLEHISCRRLRRGQVADAHNRRRSLRIVCRQAPTAILGPRGIARETGCICHFNLAFAVGLKLGLVRPAPVRGRAPLSVWPGLLGAPVSRDQHSLISGFGIRGIGSIYDLMYAINHGLPRALAEEIIALTLTVTPPMNSTRDGKPGGAGADQRTRNIYNRLATPQTFHSGVSPRPFGF